MKILVCDPIADEGVEMMRQASIKVDVKTGLTFEELEAIIGDYHGIIVRSATQVRRPLIDAGRNLKLIVRAGVGLDNIDVDYAKSKGIEVMNTPEAISASVAELTIGYLFALARCIPQTTASLKANKWEKKRFIGKEIAGKTLGLIGCGRIGQKVAEWAAALGMKVIFHRRTPTELPYATQVPLEELLRRSDYISVHVPLTDETRNMIDAPEFEMMKDGVHIINCARGGIVNEDALYEAIKSGKVKGAALDVYLKEPAKDSKPFKNKLFELDEVIGSPHIGASTVEAQYRVGIEVARKVIEFYEGTLSEEEARMSKNLSKSRPRLEIVAVEKIVIHEHFDETISPELAKIIRRDGVLKSPPIVAELGEGRYVHLDGANRITAFKKLEGKGLDCKDVLVQIVDYFDEESVRLDSWCHLTQMKKEAFLRQLKSIEDIEEPDEIDYKSARDLLRKRQVLCCLFFRDKSVYAVEGERELESRVKSLNEIVNIYKDKMERGILEPEKYELKEQIEGLFEKYKDRNIIIAFPNFTPTEVVEIAKRLAAGESDVKIPTGITRHIITEGRALRVNFPLMILKSKLISLKTKNDLLREFLNEKKKPRRYEEPTLMYDE
jgi:D-3-phosphoglycerate dehydrogenase